MLEVNTVLDYEKLMFTQLETCQPYTPASLDYHILGNSMAARQAAWTKANQVCGTLHINLTVEMNHKGVWTYQANKSLDKRGTSPLAKTILSCYSINFSSIQEPPQTWRTLRSDRQPIEGSPISIQLSILLQSLRSGLQRLSIDWRFANWRDKSHNKKPLFLPLGPANF